MRQILALLILPSLLAAEEAPVTAGAIRWDAWSGGSVTREVERSLSPEKHRHRLPWFATVDAEGRAHIDGSAPGVMEQEIAHAAAAGLSYWAFLLYPEKGDMSTALTRYLQSPERGKIGFCVILHNTFGVPGKAWQGERDRVIRLMAEPGYQKVLNGRPLVFYFGSGMESKMVSERFADLRSAASSAGYDPCYVFMGWNPPRDFKEQAPKGFAAVSGYAWAAGVTTYAELAGETEQRCWDRARHAGVPYVPLVTTGWDKRPRQDHPVSWEKDAEYLTQKTFPSMATPEEIAGHLERALRFVKSNPAICPMRTVVFYAWNEHDEGGWLCPTWTPSGKPDTRRIEAVRKVLKKGGLE